MTQTFAYLEDYISDFSNPKKNWEAFCKAQDTGKVVYVTQKILVDGWIHKTKHDLRFTGFNKETCGITFLTKVSKRQGTFVCDNSDREFHDKGIKYTGLSIDISNLTLTTGYYHQNKGKDYFGKDYRPTGAQYLYRENEANTVIDVEKVSITNCTLNGDWAIYYEPNDAMEFMMKFPNLKEGKKYGIQKVDFNNNHLHLCNSLLKVDAFPNVTNIFHNVLKDCIGVAVKTNFCANTYALGNTFENSFTIEPKMIGKGTHYCCLVLCQGGTLTGRNNRFKNLTGTGPQIEIYPYFVSGMGSINWKNNPQENVSFVADIRQFSCLIKNKNAINLIFKNNNVSVSDKTFIELGMHGKELSSIIAGYGTGEKGTRCEISGNTFEVPYINETSTLRNASHAVYSNTFAVEKILTDTLFDDTTGERAFTDFSDNTFKIGEVEGGVLNLFSTTKTVTGKVNFSKNNFYFENPCVVTFGSNIKTDNVNYGINTLSFESTENFINKGFIVPGIFVNFNEVGYPYTKHFEFQSHVQELYSDATTYIKTLEGMGTARVKVEKNASKELGLVLFRDKDFSYGGNANEFFKDGSILIKISISDKYHYELEVRDMNTLIFGKTTVKTIERRKEEATVIPEVNGKKTDFDLVHETKGKLAYIGLKNMWSLEDFEVSVSMEVKKQ